MSPRVWTACAIVVAVSIGTIPSALGAQDRESIQTWQKLSLDGGSSRIYFRNDSKQSIRITHIILDDCVNTRERCEDHEINLTVPAGSTLVGMTLQREKGGRNWGFHYSFKSDGDILTRPTVGGEMASSVLRVNEVVVVPVESLVVGVRATTAHANCGRIESTGLAEGNKALVMFFGNDRSRPERVVTADYRADGSPVSFTDNRGEIFTSNRTNSRDSTKLRTEITIDVLHEQVTLRNTGKGQSGVWYGASGPGLLTAASLDRPADILTRMWKECGPKY